MHRKRGVHLRFHEFYSIFAAPSKDFSIGNYTCRKTCQNTAVRGEQFLADSWQFPEGKTYTKPSLMTGRFHGKLVKIQVQFSDFCQNSQNSHCDSANCQIYSKSSFKTGCFHENFVRNMHWFHEFFLQFATPNIENLYGGLFWGC